MNAKMLRAFAVAVLLTLAWAGLANAAPVREMHADGYRAPVHQVYWGRHHHPEWHHRDWHRAHHEYYR
jgi:hypothetical protein